MSDQAIHEYWAGLTIVSVGSFQSVNNNVTVPHVPHPVAIHADCSTNVLLPGQLLHVAGNVWLHSSPSATENDV